MSSSKPQKIVIVILIFIALNIFFLFFGGVSDDNLVPNTMQVSETETQIYINSDSIKDTDALPDEVNIKLGTSESYAIFDEVQSRSIDTEKTPDLITGQVIKQKIEQITERIVKDFVWVETDGFVPESTGGKIILPSIGQKTFKCDGTVDNPDCFEISACSISQKPCYEFDNGNTIVYVNHFSGAFNTMTWTTDDDWNSGTYTDTINSTGDLILANTNITGTYLSNITDTIYTIIRIKPIWNSTEQDSNKNITVEISADAGETWLTATNNTNYTGGAGIGMGTELLYRVNFSTNDSGISPELHDITLYYDTVTDIPTITIFEPLNTTTYDTTPHINATQTDNDPDSMWYSIDGGANITGTWTTEIDTTTTTLSDDSHYITVYANDTLGNLNSSTIWFEISICDSGTLDTICYINTAKGIQNESSITGSGSLILQSGGALYNTTNLVSFDLNMLGNITLETGSNITANVNIIASNLTIESGSSINANGLGYSPGAIGSSGNGPGAGTQYNTGAGAGYGGVGGDGYDGSGGISYGNLIEPIDFGSSGGSSSKIIGGSGGGRIIINISNQILIDGSILTSGHNGLYASFGSGGGSGGSIYLISSFLDGSGLISSNGGDSGNGYQENYYDGGGGAGGRIAIYADNFDYSGTIESKGATGNQQQAGQGGTIYINISNNLAPLGSILANSTDANRLGTTVVNFINDSISDCLDIYANNPKFNPIPWLHDDMNMGCMDNIDCVIYKIYTNMTYSRNFTSLNITNANVYATADNLELNATDNFILDSGSVSLLDNTTFNTDVDLNIYQSTFEIGDNGTLTIGNNLQADQSTFILGDNTILPINNLKLDQSTMTIGLNPIIPSFNYFNMTESTINIRNNTIINLTNSLNLIQSTINNNNNYLETISLISSKEISLTSSSSINANVNIFAANLTIESGSSIDANGLGYPSPSVGLPGNGPGAGSHYITGAGAGYGGFGGNGYWGSGGSSYGMLITPIDFGSSGGSSDPATGWYNAYGGAGGGLVILNISNTIYLTGSILTSGSNGIYSCRGSGGGSGGSIYIISSTFNGSGLISSNGGSGGKGGCDNRYDGGGGSGGRIAIYTDFFDYSGTIESKGAYADTGAEAGHGGTIYIEGSDTFNTTTTLLSNSTDVARPGSTHIVYATTPDGRCDVADAILNPYPTFYIAVYNKTYSYRCIANQTATDISLMDQYNVTKTIFGLNLPIYATYKLKEYVADQDTYYEVNGTGTMITNITGRGPYSMNSMFDNTSKTNESFKESMAGNYSFLANVSGLSLFNLSYNRYDLLYVYEVIDPPDIYFEPPTPVNNSYITDDYVYLNWSMISIYDDTILVNWNGTNITTTDKYYNMTGIVDGIYTYYIWANDTAGGSNKTETRTMTIDNTPPIINITSPTNTDYHTKDILLSILASDTVTLITECRYSLDSTTYTDLPKESYIVYRKRLFNLDTGPYNITFTCINAAGLQTTTETIYFNITFGKVTIKLIGSGFLPDIDPEDNYIASELPHGTVTALVHAEGDFKEVTDNNGMSLRNSIGSKTYLVYTKGTTDNIKDRTEHIKTGEFEKMPNPSFGFLITDKYKVYIGLEYDQIDFNGKDHLNEGFYEFKFKNTGVIGNKLSIEIKR